MKEITKLDEYELEEWVDCICERAAFGELIESFLSIGPKLSMENFISLCKKYPELADAYEDGINNYIWHLSTELSNGKDVYNTIESYRKEIKAFKKMLISGS